jgi:two-component system, sensor histidine kinase and response regulator
MRTFDEKQGNDDRHLEQGPGGKPMPAVFPDQILRLDGTGRLLRIECPRYPGEFMSNAIGKTFAEYLPERVAARCLAAVEQAIAEDRVAVLSYSTAGSDGIRDFEARFSATSDDECIGAVRDVTRPNRALARLQRMVNIFDATPDLVCSFALDGEVEYINEALADMLGDKAINLRSMEDVLDQFPETRQLFDEAVIPAILEQGFWRGDLDYVSGREDVPVSTIVLGHRRPGRLPDYVSIIARDIRRSLRNERDLIAARQAAEAASRAKGDFLATMSHEIRTPMNGVLGSADLLLETDLTTEQRDLAGMLRESGESLLGIVNDVLDFSKIEATAIQLEHVPFALRPAIDGVCRTLAAAANHKGLELLVSINGNVPPVVVGDPSRLKQILVNLVGNSVKFTERGRVIVRVACVGETSSDGSVLLFEVEDSGIGIAPEVQSRLFIPFTQADSSMSRRFGGTGLGLAISSGLARLMGGEIFVRSEANVGSTFWFTVVLGLPAVRQESAAESPIQNMRAIVLDSEPESQEIELRQLAAWGMRVSAAKGEQEARDAMRIARETGDPFACVLINSVGGAAAADVGSWFDRTADLDGVAVIVLGRPSDRPEVQSPGVAFVSKPARASDVYDSLVRLLVPAMDGASDLPVNRPPKPEAAPVLVLETGNHRIARILLVEDNEINKRLACAMLGKLGYSPDSASDGFEAVRAASETRYDLILMDCQMPGMDGFEATRKVRDSEKGSRRHVPIVALTANAMASDRDRCLEAGMDDYLAKPLRPGGLREAVARWVASAATTDTDAAEAGPIDAKALASVEGATVQRLPILDPEIMADIRSLGVDSADDTLGPLVELLLKQTEEQLPMIEAAMVAGDAPTLVSLAHTLKGASRNLGARLLGEVAAEMERRAREGAAAQDDLLGELRSAFYATSSAFLTERAEFENSHGKLGPPSNNGTRTEARGGQ